jgi:DMSO/TMAO reductase YedYZ molybdopterin-dependent catalytic subunit
VPRFVPLALTAALLCAGVAVATETSALASSDAKGGATRVTGQVRHPLTLSVADLAKYKQHTVKVSYLGGMPMEALRHHTFSGPLLLDVLQKAGPRFSTAKNDALAWGILVTGAGNYRALIAWGEIMPELAKTQIVLAISEDGKPLAKPHLAVPGDKGGGRYVDDVATIRITGP